MDAKQLAILETNALALRKIADAVLEQVQALKPRIPARSRKKAEKIDRVAELTARLVSGKRKPERAKK